MTGAPAAAGCAWCARGTSTRRRTPPARLATARGSAPPSPAARTPATCAAMGAGGERQPRHWAALYCQYRCARGAAHRGSGRIAPEAARHARTRSARHPAPSAGTPAAAALWQLCCHIGTTTTIACQVVDSRARYHRVQTATIAERGANAGTARRARDGRRAYPANRHRVCIRTRSCVRRLTISIAIGAAFGYDTRAHVLSRTLTRREASQCAVRPQSGQTPAGVTPRATWCLRGSELVLPV